MTTINEIAPDVYRICTYVADFDLQFCQFLIKDDEPLLWETGMKQMFPAVRDAVAKIVSDNPRSAGFRSAITSRTSAGL